MGKTTTPSASPTFPRGAYGKYKRATGFFLRWLLRVREARGDSASGAKKRPKKKTKLKCNATLSTADSTLDTYARIVTAIVADPAALPVALRRQWPRALAACACAITLRAQVAQYFQPTSSEDPHLHFLARLREWLEQLRGASVERDGVQDPVATFDANGKALDFANYYDVLDLPDDFFDHEAGDQGAVSPSMASFRSTSRPLSRAARKRLVEEPFQDDAALELAYFLMEIDELSEAVYSAFHDVKTGKKSLLEATMMTLVAIDFSKTVIAQFQLRQPDIRDALDISKLIHKLIPEETTKAKAREVSSS